METLDIETVPPPLFVFGLVCLALVAAGIAVDIVLALSSAARRPDRGRRLRVLVQRPWSWRHAVALFLMLVALQGFLGSLLVALRRFSPLARARGDALLIVIQAAVIHAAALALVVLLTRGRGVSWHRAFGIEWRALPRAARRAVVAYLAAFPALAFLSLAYVGFLQHLGIPLDPQGSVQLFRDPANPVWARATLAVLAVAVAPVTEELLFRGILLPVLARRLGAGVAIGTVSLLFALLHFHVPSFVPLYLIATAFSIAYLVHGNLTVSILMHALFNGLSLLAMLLLRNITDLPG